MKRGAAFSIPKIKASTDLNTPGARNTHAVHMCSTHLGWNEQLQMSKHVLPHRNATTKQTPHSLSLNLAHLRNGCSVLVTKYHPSHIPHSPHTWERTVKTHLLSISWELLLIRQHKVTGNDFFWYSTKCWLARSIKEKIMLQLKMLQCGMITGWNQSKYSKKSKQQWD